MAERPGAEPSCVASARSADSTTWARPASTSAGRASQRFLLELRCAARGSPCVLRRSATAARSASRSAARRIAVSGSSGFSTTTVSSARRRSLTKRVTASRTRAVSSAWTWNSSSTIARRRGSGRSRFDRHQLLHDTVLAQLEVLDRESGNGSSRSIGDERRDAHAVGRSRGQRQRGHAGNGGNAGNDEQRRESQTVHSGGPHPSCYNPAVPTNVRIDEPAVRTKALG